MVTLIWPDLTAMATAAATATAEQWLFFIPAIDSLQHVNILSVSILYIGHCLIRCRQIASRGPLVETKVSTHWCSFPESLLFAKTLLLRFLNLHATLRNVLANNKFSGNEHQWVETVVTTGGPRDAICRQRIISAKSTSHQPQQQSPAKLTLSLGCYWKKQQQQQRRSVVSQDRCLADYLAI